MVLLAFCSFNYTIERLLHIADHTTGDFLPCIPNRLGAKGIRITVNNDYPWTGMRFLFTTATVADLLRVPGATVQADCYNLLFPKILFRSKLYLGEYGIQRIPFRLPWANLKSPPQSAHIHFPDKTVHSPDNSGASSPPAIHAASVHLLPCCINSPHISLCLFLSVFTKHS